MKSWLKLTTIEPAAAPADDPLNYDQLVHLDAEDLAEQGILVAYTALRTRLMSYAKSVLELSEEVDCEAGAYCVVGDGMRHVIWETDLVNRDGWERATVAFFELVNANLRHSEHRFYALYCGNDLSGIFLTDMEFRAARTAIQNPAHWPWVPVNDPPDYGYPIANAA